MNLSLSKITLVFLALIFCCSFVPSKGDWGFFGHRRINRMAVFTLPQEVFGFYKKHIEFITEHAVDPDKRRYASKHEAVNHYIDLDHWGEYPFDNVPRDLSDALIRYTTVHILTAKGDTVQVLGDDVVEMTNDSLIITHKPLLRKLKQDYLAIDKKAYEQYFLDRIYAYYYDDEKWANLDSFELFFKKETNIDLDAKQIFATNTFAEYGVLPYNLLRYHYKLVNAFEQKNIEYILRVSADIGHYIGDAHVPLHTTENYNGQLTNQDGIHAFWESRIPELFADQSFDFFVGKAKYIDDPKSFYWDMVFESHSLLDSVLLIEQSLRETFPQDKQFCFEERLNRTIYTQCTEFAKTYNDRMQGMVEKRMRDAVYALGCAWYSAWVDAGKPDLSDLDLFSPNEAFKKEMEKEEELFKRGEAKGRKHVE